MATRGRHSGLKPPSTPKSKQSSTKPPIPGSRRCKTCHSFGCVTTKGIPCQKPKCATWASCPTFYADKHQIDSAAAYQEEVSLHLYSLPNSHKHLLIFKLVKSVLQ